MIEKSRLCIMRAVSRCATKKQTADFLVINLNVGPDENIAGLCLVHLTPFSQAVTGGVAELAVLTQLLEEKLTEEEN